LFIFSKKMLKLLLYVVLSLINIALFLNSLIVWGSRFYMDFLYLTILSFTSSMVYLAINAVYEILFYVKRNEEWRVQQLKEGAFYNFIRDRFFKYVFTCECTICIAYWMLCMGGETIMVLPKGLNLAVTIYLHFLIGLQIFLESILTQRSHLKDLFYFDYVFLLVAIILYSIFLTAMNKLYDLGTYPFLKLNYGPIIAINMGMFLISFNVYQVLDYIVAKKGLKEVGDSSREKKLINYDYV